MTPAVLFSYYTPLWALYDTLWWAVDFGVALTIFFGLAYYALSRRLGEDQPVRAMAFGLALALSLSFVLWESYSGITLLSVWPFALIALLILGMILFLELFRKLGQAFGFPWIPAALSAKGASPRSIVNALAPTLSTVAHQIRKAGHATQVEREKLAAQLSQLSKNVEQGLRTAAEAVSSLRTELHKAAAEKDKEKINVASAQFQDAKLYQWASQKIQANLKAAIENIEHNGSPKDTVKSIMECFKAMDAIEKTGGPTA